MTVLDDRDLVAEFLRDFKYVCGEEDRTAVIAEITHHLLDDKCRLRIESDKRLIHDQEFRGVEESGDDRQFLLHTMRVGRDLIIQCTKELQVSRVFLDALFSHIFRNTENISDEIQELKSGKVIVKFRIIRDICEDALGLERIFFNRDPVDRDRSLLKVVKSGDRLDGRGLAGTVMTDESIDLPRLNFQRQIGYTNLSSRICFRQMFDYQHDFFPPDNTLYFHRSARLSCSRRARHFFLPDFILGINPQPIAKHL